MIPVLRGETSGGKRAGPAWIVKGQVRRVLVVDRKTYLGRYSDMSSPLPSWSIPLEVLVPLASLSAEVAVRGYSTSVELPESGTGKSVLRLKSPPSLPLGAFEGEITLKPVLKGGELLPQRCIRFGGTIVSDIQIQPPVVQVGSRRLHETFEEMVNLRSLTDRAVTVLKVEVDGDGLSVETVERNERYRVRQKVRAVGGQTNHVRFVTESAGRQVTVTLPVSYMGIETE